MNKLLLTLAASSAVLLTAASSQAQNVGTLNSPGFSYGTLAGNGLSAYTPHAAGDPRCLGLNGCYVGGDTFAIIGRSSNAGELLVHPGPGPGGNSAIAFTSTTLGLYNLNALGISYDVGAKTVGYFTIIGGVLTTFNSGSISGGNPQANIAGTSQAITANSLLRSGDSFGVFVNNGNGDYTGDSTHFSGTVSAVPEPATWGMMVLGFGLIGFGLRSRRKHQVRVTYA